jgi:two-component system, cell cycle response regulator
VLRTNTRVFDSLARYGGEEFAVVMPGTTMEDAQLAADRLRSAVEAAPFATEAGQKLHLTISVGVACSSQHPITPESLLRAADVALYAAKRAGRNRVELAPSIAPGP